MRTLLLLLALAGTAHAQKRDVGQLVYDGIPEVPRRIGERAQQYQAARGATFLDWDPAGGMLVATRFGDTNQVHHVDAPGGDRRQLTFQREPVTEAYIGKARPDRGFFFRMDQGGGEFYQYYWFERSTGAAQLVTDGKSRNESFLPANGGGRFAFASTQRDGKDFDIYVMDGFDGRTVKRARECEGQWGPLDWSADDSKLLLDHYVSIEESYLFVQDLATGVTAPVNEQPGKKINYGTGVFARKGAQLYFTSDEDSQFLRLWQSSLDGKKKEVISPAIDWDVSGLAISQDGAWLAYTVNEAGRSQLYLAATATPKKAMRVELPPGVVVSKLRFDPKSQRVAFSLSTAQSLGDAYTVDVKTRKLTRWTFSEVGGLNPSVFVTPELVKLKSFDGLEFSAWYYKPRSADASHKAPVVLLIHGGPEGQATAAFSSQIQYWVNELGAAVVVPNVRGSSGYGKKFLTLDDGMKREDSVKDIGEVISWIGERPELDKARVGVYGGSYGGYMVLATMFRFPERIRCGVDIVGISNFVSFLEHTEAYRRDLRRAEYGDERDPEMRKFLLSIAPLKNAEKIVKPLFVAQGKNDPRVPASEAEQIVSTVRGRGGKVWYMLARDEGHGFQKKTNRDAFSDAVTLFFEENLLK
jgi:dipeptidyl aminopeptidase/acylaminoacyl peptidase